ncbi:MAG: cyclic nucleotide-binding domain-containing protein [Spirochaetes bacterium]|nr:cyclic nucleotide-binding domain-containing protein [Spirochaetota bacterium]
MFDLKRQAEAMKQRYLRKGDYVYRTGKPCDGNMFVVVEGELVEIDAKDNPKLGYEVGPGGFIGDLEVMSGSLIRVQTYKVTSLAATLGVLDKRDMQLVGGVYPEFFLQLLRSAVDHLHAAERGLIAAGKTKG